jgi:uncharacterized membrane protein
MVNNAIRFGLSLVLVGLYGYFGYDTRSLTALIPAVVGIALIVAGLAARAEENRKNAMHAAAVVALLGAIAAWGRLATTGLDGDGVWMLLLMGVICTVFVGLCVKSFIAAKDAREKSQQQQHAKVKRDIDQKMADESASIEDSSLAIEDGDEE